MVSNKQIFSHSLHLLVKQWCQNHIIQEGEDGPVSVTEYQISFESTGLLIQEKKFKIDFQDGGHLGFPIGTILAIFDLQVTLICPTKFESIEKIKIDNQV